MVSLICFVLFTLMACSAQYVRWQPRAYTVQEGDTLYSIAWQHELDYRTLAAWNDIGNNYLIYPGQQLRLSPPAGGTATAGRIEPASRQTPSSQPASRPEPESNPGDTVRLPAVGSIAWQWPAGGPVIADYNAPNVTGKGIDIGGQFSSDINAAAAGRVVYSGSGLIGYGKLIIIKHNEHYLSAYGHNSELYVEEGDEVMAGARIAAMGNGPNRTPMLHFEIRRNGESVNPMDFLPAR